MKIVALLLSLVIGLWLVGPAHAQATRTWVSGVGNDANPCSFTAPCKTFAGAFPKTAVNGEIDCLDPGGFGTLTILKSITIDCTGVFGSVLHTGTNGFLINFDGFAATDTRKAVRIRGLSFNGADSGLNSIRIIGTAASLGSEVFIENVVIDGDFGGTARGISDERTGGGELSVLNTSIRNTGGICIALLTGTVRKDAIIDNVSALNCNVGLFAANLVKVMITHSTFSLNTQVGVQADTGGEVNIDYSVISGNGTGVSSAGIVRMSNTQVSLNNTGFAGSAAVQSFGNNRVVGNAGLGNALAGIGAVSNDLGQQ